MRYGSFKCVHVENGVLEVGDVLWDTEEDGSPHYSRAPVVLRGVRGALLPVSTRPRATPVSVRCACVHRAPWCPLRRGTTPRRWKGRGLLWPALRRPFVLPRLPTGGSAFRALSTPWVFLTNPTAVVIIVIMCRDDIDLLHWWSYYFLGTIPNDSLGTPPQIIVLHLQLVINYVLRWKNVISPFLKYSISKICYVPESDSLIYTSCQNHLSI